jgi:hypothetical protein
LTFDQSSLQFITASGRAVMNGFFLLQFVLVYMMSGTKCLSSTYR